MWNLCGHPKFVCEGPGVEVIKVKSSKLLSGYVFIELFRVVD